MREIAFALLLTACTTDVESSGSAVFSGQPMIVSAKAQQGFISYGAPFHFWTITLLTANGCTATAVGSVEIDTVSGMVAAPLGDIPLRTTEQLQVAPSAFVRFMDMATVSGTITVENANQVLITGHLDAQLATGPLTGTFTALVCPS